MKNLLLKYAVICYSEEELNKFLIMIDSSEVKINNFPCIAYANAGVNKGFLTIGEISNENITKLYKEKLKIIQVIDFKVLNEKENV